MNLMIQCEEFLASNLFSIVVGAQSNVGGVGGSEGSEGNSIRGTSMLHNRHSSVERGNSIVDSGEESVVGAVESAVGYKGISLTLDDMLNFTVLGDVFGSESSIRLSSVVAGAVVVGDLVGNRSSVGNRNRLDNMATGSVGDRVENIAASCVGNRVVNRVNSRVCVDWKKRVSSQRGNSSMVDNSRVSLSLGLRISLANAVDIRQGVVSIRISVQSSVGRYSRNISVGAVKRLEKR